MLANACTWLVRWRELKSRLPPFAPFLSPVSFLFLSPFWFFFGFCGSLSLLTSQHVADSLGARGEQRLSQGDTLQRLTLLRGLLDILHKLRGRSRQGGSRRPRVSAEKRSHLLLILELRLGGALFSVRLFRWHRLVCFGGEREAFKPRTTVVRV